MIQEEASEICQKEMADASKTIVSLLLVFELLILANLQDLPLPNSFINPDVEAAKYLWDGITKREIKEFSDVLFVEDSRDPSSAVITFAKGHGLDGPWGIVVDESYVYVASFTTDRIHKYDKKSARFLEAFGNENELDCPEGMAFGPNDTLYVASFLNDKVVKYAKQGNYLGDLADKSDGLKGPEGVAFLRNGSLLVTSHYTDNILLFDTEKGKKLGVFAQVDKPVGIIVGNDGHVYVTSYTTNNVMRFNGKSGTFMDIFARSDGLRGPSSLSFADSRSLYCASYDNDKIILFNSTSGVSITLHSKTTIEV